VTGALDAWLRAGAGSGRPCRLVEETPCAQVYIGRDRVLKLKKPVDFGFLDFTTLAKREWAIRRELAFNCETAPDVYRAVRAITRTDGGELALDGAGEVVDWALEMRPFDPSAVLSHRPERVDGALADQLGREVARVQALGPIAQARSGSAALEYVLRSNAAQLRSLTHILDPEAVERLIADSRAAFARFAPLLDQRGVDGFVRRCHGDLHLGNVVVEDGRPLLFDCIEFNDVLSEIDIGYDIAFLMMDLSFRGRGEAANRVLNAWLDEAARSFGDGIWPGLAALSLFQSVRAAVRTHVSGHGGEVDKARAYLAEAQRHLEAQAPRLYAVGGLSGSGKSTLARALAPELGSAPGAVILRTDEIRKRLWGAGPLERLPLEAYASNQSSSVYGEMLRLARLCLSAGWSVVLDAVFAKVEERKAAEALGQAVGLPLRGLWLEAPPDVLRARVAARRDDASDADLRVLEQQLSWGPVQSDWRRIDAEAPLADQTVAALAAE
jgi:aminoglycoside phosphotransferase family enzyme/predicted kinase